jgi:hypothetical protein
MNPTDDELLFRIPGLNHQDAAVIQSLLRAAGFFCRVHDGFGKSPPAVFIRPIDLPDVKAFLADYRIRSPRDEPMSIPW